MPRRKLTHRIQRTYSPGEIHAIRERYPREGSAGLARELGRSEHAIQSKASRLGLPHHDVWPPDVDEYLSRYRGMMTVPELAAAVGKPRRTVARRLAELGIRRRRELSAEAQQILWELRDQPDAIAHCAEIFRVSLAHAQRAAKRYQEAGL